MKEKFLIIAVTTPVEYPGEAERITELLDSGEADIVHIRKPAWDAAKTEKLIRQIPERLYPRLRLHDHFSLAEKYNLGGVHLNSRNLSAPATIKNLSRSVHSLDEIERYQELDYLTLSPIFDSISKPGYKSNFDLKELKDKITGKRIIALGGVTPEKIPSLREVGFIGAAMLGHFWKT